MDQGLERDPWIPRDLTKDSAGFDQNTMRDSSNNRIRDLTATEEA